LYEDDGNRSRCLYARNSKGTEIPVQKNFLTDICKAKASPSYEKECVLGLIGNVFHTKDIEAANQKGTGYSSSEINDY
jgi:hypothetical protein